MSARTKQTTDDMGRWREKKAGQAYRPCPRSWQHPYLASWCPGCSLQVPWRSCGRCGTGSDPPVLAAGRRDCGQNSPTGRGADWGCALAFRSLPGSASFGGQRLMQTCICCYKQITTAKTRTFTTRCHRQTAPLVLEVEAANSEQRTAHSAEPQPTAMHG